MVMFGARVWKISKIYNTNSTSSSLFGSRLRSVLSSKGMVWVWQARSSEFVSFSAAFRITKRDSRA